MKIGDTIHGYALVHRLDLGGSERQFFRCSKAGKTFVMVHDPDIESYLTLQDHLWSRHIGVPEIYWHNSKEKLVVEEDLGDASLHALCQQGRQSRELYHRAIDELIKLQFDGRPGAPVQHFYDRAHIEWEQRYFCDHFLIQYCKLSKTQLSKIDADLRTLADDLIKTMPPISDYLMHRDYQSQNIYLKNEKIRIIDFQSARIGPLTYDLAALLRDAYVHMSLEEERALVEYYLTRIRKRGVVLDAMDFQHVYELSCLQRNMQALGAFSNLSLNKNKPGFAQHVPRGLALLKRGLQETHYPKLRALVMKIQV